MSILPFNYFSTSSSSYQAQGITNISGNLKRSRYSAPGSSPSKQSESDSKKRIKLEYENMPEEEVQEAPIRNLTQEILFQIFSYLTPNDQGAATCVCRNWRVVGEDPGLKEVRQSCFGKAKWNRYFGDIGTEPPLPSNIRQILNSECIFWPGKKVRDTHLLVLVPNTVNGRAFHLDSLAELIKSPKTGHKTQYIYYHSDVKKELGAKSKSSHWALMTRDVIPKSRSKTYDNQKALVASHAQKSGIPYELPSALDAATAILMEHAQTGNRLYSDDPYTTYTRCQEKVGKTQWPADIGIFSYWGFCVSYGLEISSFSVGVGCVQKFCVSS